MLKKDWYKKNLLEPEESLVKTGTVSRIWNFLCRPSIAQHYLQSSEGVRVMLIW